MPSTTLKTAFAIRQFENHAVQQIQAILDSGKGDMFAALSKYDPTEIKSALRKMQMKELSGAIEKNAGKIYNKINQEARGLLEGMGVAVAEFNGKKMESLISEASTSVNKLKLINREEVAAIIKELPIRGIYLDKWWDKQKREIVDNLEQQVRLGMQAGETYEKLVRRIDETMKTGIKNAETLIRTSVTHVNATIDAETYEQNPDLSEYYVYEARLDNRTTPICRALDGKTFRYDDPTAPKPPQHYNCRSRIRPVIKWDELGIEPPDIKRKTIGAKNEAGIRKRTTQDEDIDYEGWLKKQPAEFQNELLGPARAKWFNEGKVNLAQMLRSDGRLLTLEQLKQRMDEWAVLPVDIKTSSEN